MDLISIIIIIVVISKIIKKAGEASESVVGKTGNPWDATVYQAPRKTTRTDSPRTQVNQQNAQWQKAAQENIAKARQRAVEKLREFERDVVGEMHTTTLAQTEAQPMNRSAMQQVRESRREALNSTIVERAKANTNANKTDVTLETMEAEHNHSERVSAAVHHHPEDIMTESMLGTVEDLMVKGYDGNLCFERDFVGEGLDMISRFSYQ